MAEIGRVLDDRRITNKAHHRGRWELIRACIIKCGDAPSLRPPTLQGHVRAEAHRGFIVSERTCLVVGSAVCKMQKPVTRVERDQLAFFESPRCKYT
eukprot:4533944-Prymnesium_polylepis.1